MRFRFLAALALLFPLGTSASARDAYVLLSGGGTPLTNNYSQYLQAREMTAYLQRTYPRDSVWVFFGIGNREGEPAILADVHQQVKEDGLLRDLWLPGFLPRNRPARKAEFLQALRQEILPAVRDGGTLYLFIGDHGSLAKREPRESVVTMWQLEPNKKSGWTTNSEEELRVSELRGVLEAGLGEGRVVFCMTQCHSGGFHFLGLQRELWPEEDWFSQPVAKWHQMTASMPPPLAAGFTAVDEASLAAGCDPDPDPDRWAGYERFVPEALLGVGLFDGKRITPGLPSFAAAHDAAVMIDQTIDKPRSTSEEYLEQWAGLIERLADEPMLKPETKAAVAAYRRAVDTGLARNSDAAFAARRGQFDRFVTQMTKQNPSAAKTLASGSRAELEKAMGPVERRAGRPRPPATNTPGERLKLWQDVVRPAWKAAVDAKQVAGLGDEARTFEQYLLAQEEKGRDLLFARGWQTPILNDIYWRSGYAFPAKLKAKEAEAVSRWGAQRRLKIGEWGRASQDPRVAEAARKLFPATAGRSGPPPPRTLGANIAAERTLFYRRTLAAWDFLLTMNHTTALAELSQLIALENTPLPVR